MTQGENKYWFPAKRYGWGWGFPSCWQGWAVMGTYIILLFAGMAPLLEHQHPLLGIGFAITLSIILVIVCWLKGEPPRWRWGSK